MSRAIGAFIVSFSVIIVVAAVVVGIFLFVDRSDSAASNEQSIDDMNDYSFETAEITTDLIDGRFVRIQFRIITDGKKSLKELEKRDFQIENILIKEISRMNEEDFTTGLNNVEQTLQDSINEIMTDGQINEVYTVRKILQ